MGWEGKGKEGIKEDECRREKNSREEKNRKGGYWEARGEEIKTNKGQKVPVNNHDIQSKNQ